MRTSCLSCGATYDFPLSALAPGEELFVRCTSCQAVMTVSEKLAKTMRKSSASVSTLSLSAVQNEDPTKPDLPTLVRRVPTKQKPWFASINGVQNGPFSEADLNAMAERDMLSASTYLWKAGFEEWKRAHETEEFNGWAFKAQRVRRVRELEERIENLANAGVTEFSLDDRAKAPLMPELGSEAALINNRRRVVVPPTSRESARSVFVPMALGMLMVGLVLTLALYTIPKLFF